MSSSIGGVTVKLVEYEFERQRRVVDQMMSMHAALAQRFRLRSKALSLLILILAAIAVGFAFVSSTEAFALLGIELSRTSWIGVLNVLVLVLTVTELRLDWSARAASHADIVADLARLRGAYRAVDSGAVEFATVASDLRGRFELVTGSAVAIPERDFVRLKVRHLLKRELSRLADEKPGRSMWLLRLDLWRKNGALSPKV